MNCSRGKPYQIAKPSFILILLLLLLAPLVQLLGSNNPVYQNSRLELFATHPASAGLQNTLDILEKRIEDFELQLGIYPEKRCQIVLIDRARDYQKLSLGKAEIVESSAAFYNSEDAKIYVRSIDQVQENYLKLLMHEYLHWFVEDVFIAAPLWFHEGMATIYSQQFGYERYLMYIRHSFWGQKGELFRHSFRYPSRKEEWAPFYQFSAMALRYMEQEYPKAWGEFWGRVSQNYRKGQKSHFGTTFIYSYQLSLYDFNQLFERHSRRQGYLYLFVGINSLIFILLAFSLPIIAYKRKRKMRELPDLEMPEEEAGEM